MPGRRLLALHGPRSTGARARSGVVVVVVVVAALIGLRDFLVGARSPFFADIRYTHHPLIEAGAPTGGRWPLWSDHIFNGAPIFADPQAAQYYPGTWLVRALGAADGFTVFILVHLILAALGMILWLRGRGFGAPAQLVGALTFALSGAFLNTAIHLGLFAAVAWAPLWLAAVDRALRAPSAGGVAGAGLVLAASIFAGGPQLLAAVALLTAFYAAGLAIHGRGRGLVGQATSLAGIVAIGASVAAIALLPQLEFIAYSQRSIGLELGFASHPSLAPHALWRLLLGPTLPRPGGGIEADAVELYLGGVGLVLAFAGIVSAFSRAQRREHAALAGALAAFAIVTLSAALGPALPVFRGLVAAVPGFAYFRAPSRLACVAGIAIAYLAALGLELWIRGAVDRRLLGLLAAIAVIAPGIALLASRSYGGEATAAIEAALVLLGLAALLVGRRRPERAAIVIAALTFVDLAVIAGPRSPLVLLSRTSPPSAAEIEGRDLQSLDVIAELADDPIDARVIIAVGYGHGSYNHTILRGLDGVSGYNGSSLLRFMDVMHLIEKGTFYPRAGLYRDEIALKPRRFDSHLIDMLAAPYLVTRTAPNLPRYEQIRRLYADHKTELVLRDRQALPRAYLSTRTIVAPSLGEREAALLAFDPARETVVEDPALALAGSPTITPVRVERRRSEHLILECEAEAPAILVITDCWYPGWRATVDGVDTPIAIVNHVFRGIPIGPGAHRVELIFAPTSYAIGWRITVATLFLLAAAAVTRRLWPRRRRRERAHGSAGAIAPASDSPVLKTRS